MERSTATGRARALRRAQTDAEAKLWHHLRAHRLLGHKFRRQVPIGAYIVDFVCPERGLVIELDGGQHVERVPYDDRRTAFLQSVGLRVARYWNDDVLLRTDEVLEDLVGRLNSVVVPLPSPLPAGERES